jgi:imidazolonepropionase-like amidohydrolase
MSARSVVAAAGAAALLVLAPPAGVPAAGGQPSPGLPPAAASTQPAPAAGATYAIANARIVTLAGPVIERGTVVMRDGRIAAVGADVTPPPGATVIDGTGLEVYPGFFDAVTQLGLTEIGQVRATVDVAEAEPYSPQLVALTAVHPASEHIPVARADGITHAVVVPGLGGGPGGGTPPIVGGQASAIALAGWTVEEMQIRRSVGMLVNWPTLSTGGFDFQTFTPRSRPFTEVKEEYDKRVAGLRDLIARARHYRHAVRGAGRDGVARDLALEALLPVLDGDLPLLIVASQARAIRDAVEFAAAEGLKMVLLGGEEAPKVKALLAEKRIPVILGPSLTLPEEEDDPYDAPLTRAGELHAAGVTVAMATFSSANSRTLPFEVGNAVAHGLPRDAALGAITRTPAEILGLAGDLGTIEPGRLANLIVTTGDPLEMRTRVVHVFVNGRPVSLDNRHQRLYETYRARR